MADLIWLLRRLQAMSIPEIIWRLNRKAIHGKERQRFGDSRSSVTSGVFEQELSALRMDDKRLHLNTDHPECGLRADIPLLGNFDYSALAVA